MNTNVACEFCGNSNLLVCCEVYSALEWTKRESGYPMFVPQTWEISKEISLDWVSMMKFLNLLNYSSGFGVELWLDCKLCSYFPTNPGIYKHPYEHMFIRKFYKFSNSGSAEERYQSSMDSFISDWQSFKNALLKGGFVKAKIEAAKLADL